MKKGGLFAFLILCAFVAPVLAKSPVTHVVVCWLNDDTNSDDVDMIMRESKKFAQMSGVLSLDIGRPIARERAIVESGYDFAMSVKFDDRESLRSYIKDKEHREFVEKILKPKLSKIIIYDFESK